MTPRRSADHPARSLRRRHRLRHPRRAHDRALSRPRALEDPPRHAAPRAGRRLHGRRLCARLGQARRRAAHHRAGRHQRDHADGPGARRFDADAGDLGRQPDGTLGKGLGYLHELPDQRGMMAKVALFSERVDRCGRTAPARLRAPSRSSAPGGPVPCISKFRWTRWRARPATIAAAPVARHGRPRRTAQSIAAAVSLAAAASRPLIIAGGGAKTRRGAAARRWPKSWTRRSCSPSTARGLMHGHPLGRAGEPEPVADAQS